MNSHRELVVYKFARAKLLKWQEISIFLDWLTLEMIKLDDYLANLQTFMNWQN